MEKEVISLIIHLLDINDTTTGIVNQYLDPLLGVYTPVEEVSKPNQNVHPQLTYRY